ncbi:ABC transporter ATP-binding protein [Agromyces archimandritae]|uniref:ABC-type quaternary amine transporter n=1 Tax=Agromyces archimandritae TaxID=2781962 RepID=A0A975FMU7_9MICO|nr:ABC transporter ATP-binding protein [Agromyces archimandritae]QTX04408.1 ABC transporter ATP-binding protein [Agromyces archimandritae]
MTEVRVSGMTKKYGSKPAIHGLDVTIRSGEFVTLLGPSGCGKTTTLRCMAGLERPSSGSIAMGERTVVDVANGVFVPPEKRHVGMVFQSYALWPHMSVDENVAYPLKVAGVRGGERRARLAEALAAVGLAEFGDRPVTALSGGQQQRVALARALAARPSVIFYDEPLSNLDSKLRYAMGQQVRSLHDRYETTSVYVTHDQEEAITLSDRIIVMNNGRIEQDGTPEELYDRPRTAYVADFMGFSNIVTGTVVGSGSGLVDLRVDGADLVLRGFAAEAPGSGARAALAFRASHVHIDDRDSRRPGSFDATVVRSTFLGSAVNLLLDANGLTVRARIERAELERLGMDRPAAGAVLPFSVSGSGAVIVPSEEAGAADAGPADEDAELAVVAERHAVTV